MYDIYTMTTVNEINDLYLTQAGQEQLEARQFIVRDWLQRDRSGTEEEELAEQIEIMDDVLARHGHQNNLEVVKGARLMLGLPRPGDKYDELGRNISAQKRRQEQEPWVEVTYKKKKPEHLDEDDMDDD